jgi:hypothetical protein
MDHILTSLGLREMTAAALKITMFLSYTSPPLRKFFFFKSYQNCYPKFRRNTGVGVLIDQILTTNLNVPGMERTYASGKEAHVLIFFI